MDSITAMCDTELLGRFAKGHNEAMQVLVERYKAKLFSYIYYTVKDRDVAEDIFQDVFFKVIVSLKHGRYEENGKFFPWLTRIAHNLIIDHFRRQKAQNTVSNDDYDFDLFSSLNLCDGNIEDEMVREQILKQVGTLVHELPEEQKQVVLMRYYYDMSFKEISEQTGVSINTALGRMRYAVINLRRIVESKKISLIV